MKGYNSYEEFMDAKASMARGGTGLEAEADKLKADRDAFISAGTLPGGMTVPLDHEGAMRLILEECVQLRLRKHHDYGPEPIMFFGEYGIVVRLFDKLLRLKNLLQPGRIAAVSDESLDDTFKDVLNYALIALMIRRGTFTLPVKER